jgi:hypothetical protein
MDNIMKFVLPSSDVILADKRLEFKQPYPEKTIERG